jgi:hypothetical protein
VTSTIGDRAEDTARADAGLALVISDGTALSWRDVFDEYAPAIASYARSRGVRDVEDLVQDVFVAAVRQQEDFVGDRSGLRSLLFTIAYRRPPSAVIPSPRDTGTRAHAETRSGSHRGTGRRPGRLSQPSHAGFRGTER